MKKYILLTTLLLGTATCSYAAGAGGAADDDIALTSRLARAEGLKLVAEISLEELSRGTPGATEDSLLDSIRATAASINAAFRNDGDAHAACGGRGRLKNVDHYGKWGAQVLRAIADGFVSSGRLGEIGSIGALFRGNIAETKYKDCTMSGGIDKSVEDITAYTLRLRDGEPIDADNISLGVEAAANIIHSAFHNDGDAHAACGGRGRLKNVDHYGNLGILMLRGIIDSSVSEHRLAEAGSIPELFGSKIGKTEYKDCTMAAGIDKAKSAIRAYSKSAVDKANAEDEIKLVKATLDGRRAAQRAAEEERLARARAVELEGHRTTSELAEANRIIADLRAMVGDLSGRLDVTLGRLTAVEARGPARAPSAPRERPQAAVRGRAVSPGVVPGDAAGGAGARR